LDPINWLQVNVTEGKIRMDSREIQATLDIRHRTTTNKAKNTTQKTKMMSNKGQPKKKPTMNAGA